MAEEEKKEEVEIDWLQDVLKEAEVKRESESGLKPPSVNQRENDFMNISPEEREKKFRRGNYIIIAIIIIQIIALLIVIFW